MEYVASEYQHPRACLHGLCGRKKPRSRKTVSSDTLNIDILVVGRTPKFKQNKSPGAKTSDNLKISMKERVDDSCLLGDMEFRR